MIQFIEGAAAGAAAMAFMPAIGRKIKALFVKDSKAVAAKAESGVAADVLKKL